MTTLCACGCGEPAPISSFTHVRRGYVAGQPRRFIQGHNLRADQGGQATRFQVKHGLLRRGMVDPVYRAFLAARHRCQHSSNPMWPYYGGRGIRFEFESFEQFVACLGPRPSPRHVVSRIDKAGHYAPGNVRWATAKESLVGARPNSGWINKHP